MVLSFIQASAEYIEPLYELNKQLILSYENVENIDLYRVLSWVHNKLESCIGEYTVIRADGKKAGYYHFCRNEDGEMELDDLYVFPEFQNRGIGSDVIKRCCSSVWEPVMLYVFVRNQGAVSLYQRKGFKIVKTIKDSRYIMKWYPSEMEISPL